MAERENNHRNIISKTPSNMTYLVKQGVRKYLEGVEEQFTVHTNFPAQALQCMRHPNKDDVVDAEHQH